MKKTVFFFLMNALIFSVFGQTVVYSDNFDAYNAGSNLVEQNSVNWTTWSGEAGGNDDGLVSSEIAVSSPNSLKITGESDIIFPFQNLTAGHFRISFNWYIVASGNGGYFNNLHNLAGNNSKWAFECFVDAIGNGVLIVEGIHTAFSFLPNNWLNVMLDINLDIDSISLNIDDNRIKAWKFSSDAATTTPATCQLAAINFYAGCMDNLNQSANFGTYFVDNFQVVQIEENSSIADQNGEIVAVYPNPANDFLTITLPQTATNYEFSLYSMEGKLIRKDILSSNENKIDIQGLATGIYCVKVSNAVESKVFKVLKK